MTADPRIEAAARAGWEWECERLDDRGGKWELMDAVLRQNLLDVCAVMVAAADAVTPPPPASYERRTEKIIDELRADRDALIGIVDRSEEALVRVVAERDAAVGAIEALRQLTEALRPIVGFQSPSKEQLVEYTAALKAARPLSQHTRPNNDR